MDIEIRYTPDKCRAVYAKSPIKKGDIHISETIPMSMDDVTPRSCLWLYIFASCFPNIFLLPMDWGSLMNDDKNPNFKWYPNKKNQIIFECIRDIDVGEECTIDYVYDVFEHAKKLNFDINKWNEITTRK